MADQDLTIVVNADTQEAQQNLENFSGSLGRIGEVAAGVGLERLAEKFISLGQSVITGSVQSFAESQQVMAQFDAVLKSTGGSIGMTRDQLIGLSKEVENTTSFSDEAALSAETLLLQFDKIGKDTFPQATKAAFDLATRMKSDPVSAAKLLGRALEDPAKGLTMLGRQGIKFNEEQQKMIKEMVKVGNTAGAQKIILDQLGRVMGGAAAADAATFAGQMKQMNEVIDDIKEVIGGAIVKGLMPLVDIFKPALSLIREISEGTKNWGDLTDLLTQKLGPLGTLIGLVASNGTLLKAVLTGLALTIAIAVTPAIIAAVTAAAPFLLIMGALTAAAYLLYTAWDTNFLGIRTITKFVFDAIGTYVREYFKILGELKNIMLEVAGGIRTGIGASIIWLKDRFNEAINALKNFVANLNPLKNLKLNISLPGFGSSSNGKQAGGFASGTTLVGESGPELVSLPSGSYVHNKGESKSMSNNFSPVININNPTVRSDQDIRTIINEVKQALGRQAELARLGAF